MFTKIVSASCSKFNSDHISYKREISDATDMSTK